MPPGSAIHSLTWPSAGHCLACPAIVRPLPGLPEVLCQHAPPHHQAHLLSAAVLAEGWSATVLSQRTQALTWPSAGCPVLTEDICSASTRRTYMSCPSSTAERGNQATTWTSSGCPVTVLHRRSPCSSVPTASKVPSGEKARVRI